MKSAEKPSRGHSQQAILPLLVADDRSTLSRALVAGHGVDPWRQVRTLLFVLATILGVALSSAIAHAHAPALATTTSDVGLLSAPSPEARVLTVLRAGTEVELTGAASGAFLEIVIQGRRGWAEANGLNGGIATAVVLLDVQLRAAPSADGEVLGTIPGGSTVILTGATVDGFVAAAFNDTGGWLPAAALAA
jgi:uncharacterized protein YraI